MRGSTLPPLAPPQDFPLLAGRRIDGQRVVYLDSAATTLKPHGVLDAIMRFYSRSCANVHRGDHTLSREASDLLEGARNTVARFIGAAGPEIVFTQNTTDSLNLVAAGLDLGADDNVIVSLLDHHSTILPWMSRCEVRFLPLDTSGLVDLDGLSSLVDHKTRLIALAHVSNVTGAINPIAEAVSFARERDIPIAIDGAQSVPHLPVDVVDLGCDFLAFSGHKMLGPSGVGVLYVRSEAGERLRAARLGGGTPNEVTTQGFKLKELPYRMEAGTPNIEGIIGLAAAVEYLQDLGMARVAEHDAALTRALHERFSRVSHLTMLGPEDPARKIAIASLLPSPDHSISVASLGQLLSDSYKVMARSGNHCAHPFFASIDRRGSLRLSTYVYNGEEDLDLAARALEEILCARSTR